jgi:hypothetical protein
VHLHPVLLFELARCKARHIRTNETILPNGVAAAVAGQLYAAKDGLGIMNIVTRGDLGIGQRTPRRNRSSILAVTFCTESVIRYTL